MSYRDELDAAHARITALERQLADARGELGGKTALAKAAPAGMQALIRGDAGGKAAPRWLGAPAHLRFERELEGEVPADAYTELVELMRRAFGAAGATTVLPGSLAWGLAGGQNTLVPIINIYVTSRRGKTQITAEQRLGATLGAIYGGVGGGVGGGGIALPIAAALISPLAVPVALGLWLGGTYALCRKLFRSRARFHANRLEKLADELAKLAAQAIERAAETPKP